MTWIAKLVAWWEKQLTASQWTTLTTGVQMYCDRGGCCARNIRQFSGTGPALDAADAHDVAYHGGYPNADVWEIRLVTAGGTFLTGPRQTLAQPHYVARAGSAEAIRDRVLAQLETAWQTTTNGDPR